jgi:hypothetical protein
MKWKRPVLRCSILLAGLALGVLAFVVVTRHRSGLRFEPAAETEAGRRRAEILREIARLGPEHPWAGSYSKGDGVGFDLSATLAPESGFVFESRSREGLHDRNYGTVENKPDRITLSFQFSNDHEGFRGFATELVPIRWGERRYLVPTERMDAFCSDVNSGWEPRDEMDGAYLLRCGDAAKPAIGMPLVPQQFRGLLLAAPIEAEVIQLVNAETDEHGVYRAHVILNAGAEQGVTPRMQMRLLDPPGFRLLDVGLVNPTTCSAELKGARYDDAPPQVGWKFSSKVWER